MEGRREVATLRSGSPSLLTSAGSSTRSYSVERTDPGELSADQERVKVFLQSPGRSPAPVTLRRDEASGGAWRLSQVSL